MILRRVVLLGLSILLYSSLADAAVFNTPSHLINIPIVKDSQMGRLEFGSSIGYHDNKNYEFDFMINYSLLDRVILGVNLMETDQLAGHVHWNVFNLKYFGMGAGMQYMADDKSPDTWADNETTSETAYSPYMVARLGLGPYINIHTGFGEGRFKPGLPGRGGDSVGAEGMFYGLDIKIIKLKLMAEFDGRDTNIGVSLPITRYAELNVALTELFIDGSENPNYDNWPVRNIAVGIKFHRNMISLKRDRLVELNDKMDALNNRHKDLDHLHAEMVIELDRMYEQREQLTQDVNRLKTAIRDETKFLYEKDKQKKENIRKKYIGVDQAVGEKVISLYYESFEHYYQKEYMQAIELLQKAIVLDPYMPQLYIRMGSIYYELDMPKEAYDSYMKAFDLDPHNEELLNLLSRFDN